MHLKTPICPGISDQDPSRELHTTFRKPSLWVVQIRQASKQAGVATASMGKFDKRLQGEKPGERQLGSKRRNFGPVVGDTSGEQAQVRPCLLSALSMQRCLSRQGSDLFHSGFCLSQFHTVLVLMLTRSWSG